MTDLKEIGALVLRLALGVMYVAHAALKIRCAHVAWDGRIFR